MTKNVSSVDAIICVASHSGRWASRIQFLVLSILHSLCRIATTQAYNGIHLIMLQQWFYHAQFLFSSPSAFLILAFSQEKTTAESKTTNPCRKSYEIIYCIDIYSPCCFVILPTCTFLCSVSTISVWICWSFTSTLAEPAAVIWRVHLVSTASLVVIHTTEWSREGWKQPSNGHVGHQFTTESQA